MDANKVLLHSFWTFFDRKTATTHARSEIFATRVKFATHTGTGISFNSEFGNQQLANELHTPVIRKFKNCKV